MAAGLLVMSPLLPAELDHVATRELGSEPYARWAATRHSGYSRTTSHSDAAFLAVGSSIPAAGPHDERLRPASRLRVQEESEPEPPADWPAARRYSALMRCASSSWSSRMTMRHAASIGVPLSTSSRARAAIRSW